MIVGRGPCRVISCRMCSMQDRELHRFRGHCGCSAALRDLLGMNSAPEHRICVMAIHPCAHCLLCRIWLRRWHGRTRALCCLQVRCTLWTSTTLQVGDCGRSNPPSCSWGHRQQATRRLHSHWMTQAQAPARRRRNHCLSIAVGCNPWSAVTQVVQWPMATRGRGGKGSSLLLAMQADSKTCAWPSGWEGWQSHYAI
jgi:hypothetical protein